MKGTVRIIILSACLCVLLCGCSFWMDGNYYSVTPHTGPGGNHTGENPAANSYADLLNSLTQLVETGKESGIIYLGELGQENAVFFMDLAITQLSSSNPIAAYALEEITYEVGNSAGNPAIKVQLAYARNYSEIQNIQIVHSMEQAGNAIIRALEGCEAGVVLRIKDFSDLDFIQLVQDHVEANPQTCMEMPQVSAASYPNTGKDRVLELSFTYQTSRTTLREMQETVAPIFASAKLYVSSDANTWQKYSQLYSFLMERFHYTYGTSITPTYHLLHHGVGNAKAFATVYAAMCRQVGLDCQAISGTKDGEPWHWNVMLVDGAYYHIDLIACSREDGFQVYTDSEMTGYIWDYSALLIEQ